MPTGNDLLDGAMYNGEPLQTFADNIATEINNAGGSSYLVYTALITQLASATPPTAIVLENTLGFTPTWVYDAAGYYTISNPIFDPNKTFVTLEGSKVNIGALVLEDIGDRRVREIYVDPSTVWIETYFVDFSAGNIIHTDGFLNNASVEIRVYP